MGLLIPVPYIWHRPFFILVRTDQIPDSLAFQHVKYYILYIMTVNVDCAICEILYSRKASIPESEFLDEIQTKVLSVFLLAIHSHPTALP
jgi:hypothetical protein